MGLRPGYDSHIRDVPRAPAAGGGGVWVLALAVGAGFHGVGLFRFLRK